MKRCLYIFVLIIIALELFSLERVPPQLEILGNAYHNFGEQYIGYDSDPVEFVIFNGGNYNLFIYNLIFAEQISVFSTLNSDLPITITPGDRDTLWVVFHPNSAMVSLDTLWVINNDPMNKELPIPLSGRGIRVPPAQVQNLSINLQGENAILSWDSVTTNILGGPVDPICYLIQYSEDGLPEHFWNLAVTANPVHTHFGATIYAAQRFYRVRAVYLN